MRNFTWNRFPIKNLLIDSLLTPIVESTYWNRDMRKFESSRKDESRWQSTDSSKAYRNTSAFKCVNEERFHLKSQSVENRSSNNLIPFIPVAHFRLAGSLVRWGSFALPVWNVVYCTRCAWKRKPTSGAAPLVWKLKAYWFVRANRVCAPVYCWKHCLEIKKKSKDILSDRSASRKQIFVRCFLFSGFAGKSIGGA